MTSKTVPSVAVVGMSGFAVYHRRAVADLAAEGAIRHVAQVVPPMDEKTHGEEAESLRRSGVQLYPSLRELLAAQREHVDLITIPTGIGLHRPMTVAALEAGCNVLVEKPAAGCIQDIDAMIAARDRSGRHCAVGYQYNCLEPIKQLKNWICAGRFGAIRRIRGFGCWPRDRAYYTRNRWAGCLAIDDTWLLDSPHNNALAHAVNLMCYLGCDRPLEPLALTSVQAELYRAHPIESADTAVLRAQSKEEVEIFFAVSHCTDRNIDPAFEIEAESARLKLTLDGNTTITWSDGSTEELAGADPTNGALRDMANVLTGDQAGTACSLEIARAQTLCVCGTFESSPVHDLPHDLVQRDPDAGTHVMPGMTEVILAAFEQDALPSEMDLPWARTGDEISLIDYDYFPTYRKPG